MAVGRGQLHSRGNEHWYDSEADKTAFLTGLRKNLAGAKNYNKDFWDPKIKEYEGYGVKSYKTVDQGPPPPQRPAPAPTPAPAPSPSPAPSTPAPSPPTPAPNPSPSPSPSPGGPPGGGGSRPPELGGGGPLLQALAGGGGMGGGMGQPAGWGAQGGGMGGNTLGRRQYPFQGTALARLQSSQGRVY